MCIIYLVLVLIHELSESARQMVYVRPVNKRVGDLWLGKVKRVLGEVREGFPIDGVCVDNGVWGTAVNHAVLQGLGYGLREKGLIGLITLKGRLV